MRFGSVLLLVLLSSLGAGGAAETQTTQGAKVPPAADPRTVHVIVGVVTSVDPPAGVLAVRESVPSAPQKGQKPVRRTVTLVVTAETNLILGKSPATIADLKAGDFVVARYAETPQGALALSLRAADAVGQATPSPTATPGPGETAAKEGGHR